MEEIIKIEDHNGKRAVNARELHEFLESKQEFANWIKSRIKQYGFIENQDYCSFDKIVKRDNGATVRKEYTLSIDMAKELSMVENNEKGRIARKYFIACEDKLKQGLLVMPNFSNPAEAARAWADQYEQRLKLEAKAREDAPKVEFYDTTAKSDDTFDLDNVAKTLNYKNIGRNNLFKMLKEQKVLMRNRNPYQKYVDCGYFKIIQQPFDRGGKPGINSKTVVYQKGVDFIKKLLDRLGYKRAFCKNTDIQTSLKFD